MRMNACKIIALFLHAKAGVAFSQGKSVSTGSEYVVSLGWTGL